MAGGRRNVQGLPKYYARVAWSPGLVISGFCGDTNMANTDKKRMTEEELEFLQQSRLLEAFSQVETYDARESIIMACEKLIKPKG
jgi:hypothetical protein